jgi:hypothetical protein
VGATVKVNGRDAGVTPAAVSATDGRLSVELSLKGYQPLTVELDEADIRAGRKEIRLVREAGPVTVTFSGPYPFEVVQGSRVIGPSGTRHTLKIEPGGARITLRSAEYLLNSSAQVDFQRETQEFKVPAPGTLVVFSAVETCSVIVDGNDLGYPPIPRKPIAAGPHTVSLKCQDGKEDKRQITVAAGEPERVTFPPPS